MKWYQIFLCFFILYATLQAVEQESVSPETHLIADQKKDTPPEKPAPPEPAPEEEHPEPSEMQKATENYETAFIKTIVVLVGLLVLVLLTVWMFKKISHGRLRSFNYMKSIKILEKRPLSPKSMLYLIEVGGKQVLIAESQLSVKQIATLDWIDANKDL